VPHLLEGKDVYASSSSADSLLLHSLLACHDCVNTHVTLHVIRRLIKAETGSGKTLAYLLPIVHLLQAMPEKVQRTDGAYGT
jgi:Rad3-related DNA helicase